MLLNNDNTEYSALEKKRNKKTNIKYLHKKLIMAVIVIRRWKEVIKQMLHFLDGV